MIGSLRISHAAALTALLAAGAGVCAARAQTPAPAASVAALKTIKFTLHFARPGQYQCYPIIGGRRISEAITVPPGQTDLPIEVSTNTDGIEILDVVSGLVAPIPLGKVRRNHTISVKPDNFNQIQAVVIQVLSKNGEPAAEGVVRFTPAGMTEPLQYSLKTQDNGEARFENVPLGSAQAVAYAKTGGDPAKQTFTVAAASGGNAMHVQLTLPVEVRTVEPSPAPGAVAAKEKEKEPKNDWVSGVLGLALLAGVGYAGWRYLQKRNLTVSDAMKGLGVDMPGSDIGGAHAGLRPSEPLAPFAPPLPPLADLPEAGVATGLVPVSPSAAAHGPRLVGLAGAVAGHTYALITDTETMLTVGRDPKSTIPLPNDSVASRRHAVFLKSGTGWDVSDEASMNGTYLNSRRVTDRMALSAGDEIQIGLARFRFEME